MRERFQTNSRFKLQTVETLNFSISNALSHLSFYEFSALSLYVKKLRHGYKQPSATDKIYTETRCVPSSTIFVYFYKLLPKNLRAFIEHYCKFSVQTATAYG